LIGFVKVGFVAVLCTFSGDGRDCRATNITVLCTFLETGVIVGLVQRTIIFAEIGCRYLSEVQRTETNNPI
jgi:hypothetical protein